MWCPIQICIALLANKLVMWYHRSILCVKKIWVAISISKLIYWPVKNSPQRPLIHQLWQAGREKCPLYATFWNFAAKFQKLYFKNLTWFFMKANSQKVETIFYFLPKKVLASQVFKISKKALVSKISPWFGINKEKDS